jgi:anaerobic ribonucleoside-triphosphate reductase
MRSLLSSNHSHYNIRTSLVWLGLGGGETPIFPIQIFRVKEGVNLNLGDLNYDLFQLACRVSSKRLFPTFRFRTCPSTPDITFRGVLRRR